MSTYIEQFKEEYLQENSTYKKDIELYIDYINYIGKGNEYNKITKEDVVNSIKYYNKNHDDNNKRWTKKIGTLATLQGYLVAINSLYNFLKKEGKTSHLFNDNDIFYIEDFANEICQHEDIDILPISPREPLPEKILTNLLKQLDIYDYDRLKVGNKHDLTRYNHYKMLRIFIKINLIVPVKKYIITNLTLKSFDELEDRILKINSYKIDIPNGLYRDLKEYLDIREQYNAKNNIEDDYLFMHSKKTNRITDTDLNWWFADFLDENNIIKINPGKNGKRSYEIEPIMISAQYNMVKNKVNVELIAKLSGCSIAQIEDKFGIYLHNDNINKLVNDSIKKNFYYKFI